MEFNDRLRASLEQILAEKNEAGVQVAAYKDGSLVLDLVASGPDTQGPAVSGGTLLPIFSASKGVVATCTHLLAERGQLDYDDAVARHWPEFAQNGKGAITVRYVLTHSAGIPRSPGEDLTDWDGTVSAIAAMPTMWEPGTRTAYHGVTFGWVLGELIRRIDGRDFAAFFRAEICEPLGLQDLYFGVSEAEESRVVDILPPDDDDATRNPYLSTFSFLNEPRIRRAIIPAMGGIGNARSLARVYALLAEGGTLDGVTLFSPERVKTMRELQVDAVDDILRLPTQRALGFLLPGPTGVGLMGAGPSAFGHTGIGGTVGLADPEHRVAFALTKNKMETSLGRRSTGARVYKVLAEAMGIARDNASH